MDIKRAEEMVPEEQISEMFEPRVHKRGLSESIGELTLSFNEVIFGPGERTIPHTHTVRQLLFITGGSGIIATETEEFSVAEGDLVSIPPDEIHWHGATDEGEFRHVSIVVRDPEHGGTIPHPE